MKKFKEFKSEQQYVTEIGPIAGALMGAMALWGGYQAFKKVKSKIKGYRKSKAEIKQNQKTGLVVDLKVFNSETGETDIVPTVIEPGSKEAGIDDDGVGKLEKKMQAAKDVKNMAARVKWEKEGGKKEEPPEDTSPEDGQPEEDGLDRDEEGNLKNQEDAQKVKDETGTAPNGWITDPEDDTKVIKKESTMLDFGEFIAEDVMKDLKKASKSKKDVEITLDDGADIPIDPITADIFVKYIEGLSSSEKNKTIKQIQRTERGFMKVLGKAHEG